VNLVAFFDVQTNQNEENGVLQQKPGDCCELVNIPFCATFRVTLDSCTGTFTSEILDLTCAPCECNVECVYFDNKVFTFDFTIELNAQVEVCLELPHITTTCSLVGFSC
jgi:hypothetical protein